MLFIVLNLLVAAVAAQQIAYFPPPNSVDDYIRVDIADGNSPITDLTIAAWIKPTTLTRSDDGFFFSYTSSTSAYDNLLSIGVRESPCIRLYVDGNALESSSCSSYSIAVGKFMIFLYSQILIYRSLYLPESNFTDKSPESNFTDKSVSANRTRQ